MEKEDFLKLIQKIKRLSTRNKDGSFMHIEIYKDKIIKILVDEVKLEF